MIPLNAGVEVPAVLGCSVQLISNMAIDLRSCCLIDDAALDASAYILAISPYWAKYHFIMQMLRCQWQQAVELQTVQTS